MRRVTGNALLAASCALAIVSGAQTSPMMVEPAPERPGDRAMTCQQLAREMGDIMKKRNMNAAVVTSKNKICRGSAVLNKQNEERQQLMTAQNAQLAAVNMTGGPVAAAVVNQTQTEQLALEARQQPGRKQAMADMYGGVGDMVSVMNDPRLMRLGMLTMEKQCAESMAPPQEEVAAADGDGCGGESVVNTDRLVASPAIAPPPGAADPFVKKSAPPAQPAASDPFAKR